MWGDCLNVRAITEFLAVKKAEGYPMSEHAYHISAREAQVILEMAMAEAKVLLPPAVTKQHWIVAHLPAAWRSVESWYRGSDRQNPDVLATLTDLALMSEALACVARVTTAGSS